MNPFSEESALEMLCSFFDHMGRPLEMAPENILQKSIAVFREQTGLNLKFLGELEYYVNSRATGFFQASDQKGYHESEPFSKFKAMRKEALKLIASCGGRVKYGHSEVGNFVREDEAFEQHEIEFLPTDPDFAAEQLIFSKWILRMLAKKMGVEISFAPKITEGKAGSGLHFHMLIEKDGNNLVLEEGKISSLSKRVIAGLIMAALHGLKMNNALEMADDLLVDGTLSDKVTSRQLMQLPASCVEYAARLQSKRQVFEAFSVFPSRLIDFTA